MDLVILGSRSHGLPTGWERHGAFALAGSMKIIAEAPADPAELKLTAILGSMTVAVPPGVRVQVDGLSLLGSRDVRVTPGDGPRVNIRANSIFGSIAIVERTQ